jgi:hypothetical protein
MRSLPEFERQEGETVVPLAFAPAQSCFVVFRRLAPQVVKADGGRSNYAEYRVAGGIPGPWRVTFDAAWGGPKRPVELATLVDWTRCEEPGIRFYSGRAVYEATFDLPPTVSAGGLEPLSLELGTVKEIAELRLNGHELGVVWTAPWRVNLPARWLKPKGNQLEIKVTNCWANRLIGDEQEPADCEWAKGDMGYGGPLKAIPDWFRKGQPRPSAGRYCFTTWNYFSKESPLRPSGLLGPVRLMAEDWALDGKARLKASPLVVRFEFGEGPLGFNVYREINMVGSGAPNP